MQRKRGRMLWALAALVLVPGAATLPGCSGGSGGGFNLNQGGSGLAQFANAVLLGNYAAANGLPAGNFKITLNANGDGGTIDIFDPIQGHLVGTVTVTQDANGNAVVTANSVAPQAIAARSAKTTRDLPLSISILLSKAAEIFGTVQNFQLNGITRTATVQDTTGRSGNPLAGRTFDSTFSSNAGSGNYRVAVAANGVDVTLSGAVTQPALFAGTFAGTGTIGLPSTPAGSDYSLTATAKITGGVADGQVLSFTGKVTSLTPTAVTIGGEVFFNGLPITTFTATAPITGGGNGVPIGLAAGSYNGTVRNLDEPNDPVIANINVRLGCNQAGNVTVNITAPGATYQRSQSNASKELSGTITGYNASTGTISIRVNAFDADPQVNRAVTITGSVKVTASGANVTAAGNLSDTLGTDYSVNLNSFTPSQTSCNL